LAASNKIRQPPFFCFLCVGYAQFGRSEALTCFCLQEFSMISTM
jgi:hypothetical protein